MTGATITPTRRPAAASALDGLEPPPRRGDVRLDRARHVLVAEGDADGHAARGASRCELLEHVEVALDERRLGDDAHRVAVLGADLEAAAGQPQRRLERLVAVGDAAEHHQLALPRRLSNASRSSSGARRLTTILVSKSVPAPKPRYSCAGPRVAVGAGVHAAAVRVDAEAEAEVGAVVVARMLLRGVVPDVDRGPRVVLLEVLERGRGEGVRRVGPGARLHAAECSDVNGVQVKTPDS